MLIARCDLTKLDAHINVVGLLDVAVKSFCTKRMHGTWSIVHRKGLELRSVLYVDQIVLFLWTILLCLVQKDVAL